MGFIISPTTDLESSSPVCFETLNEGINLLLFHFILFALD